jgi:hypothetical protein
MASLALRREESRPKEFAVGTAVTIGRLQDNIITIDNSAVSSHHACVFRDGDDFVLEDLQSTNGTFVNGRRVSRCKLQDGDVIVVGTHELVFNRLAEVSGGVSDGELVIADQDETVFLDAQTRQRALTILMNAEARSTGTVPEAATSPMVGVLRVLSGRTEQKEYVLAGHTSLIGRSKATLIRMRTWFAPDIALAITRNQTGYVATRLGGRVRINAHPLGGRYDLKDGDVLSLRGLSVEFRLRGCLPAPAPGGEPGGAAAVAAVALSS